MRQATTPRLLHNPRAAGRVPYPDALRARLGGEPARAARAEIASWQGYEPTPLRRLAGMAERVGVGEVWCKDESGRFGLGSFKALGGAYAVSRLLEERAGAGTVTVCCATAGNHGRSVAWGARMFGCRCVIYVPEGTAPARREAIAALGAEVVEVPGTYDQAVRRAAEEAERHGWWVVSDTSYPGYSEVPRMIMHGYTLLAEEVVEAWPHARPPTHVFLQCGVGGLAASVCAHFWERWGEARPRCVVVEPETAACLQLSARAGRPTVVEGELRTEMSCLACGEVSLLAWEVLQSGADHLLTVTDQDARAAVRSLVQGVAGDPPLSSAPSGAAGLAGLLAASADPALRDALGLDTGSRVLIIASEGAPPTAGNVRPTSDSDHKRNG